MAKPESRIRAEVEAMGWPEFIDDEVTDLRAENARLLALARELRMSRSRWQSAALFILAQLLGVLLLELLLFVEVL